LTATIPVRIWDLPTRVFHVALAALVTAAIATAEAGGEWMAWHLRCGEAVLALLAFRWAWGLVGGRWSRFASFMPALMLSGFIYDLRNMPLAVQVVGRVLPATHYMEVLKSLFLAGNLWPVILKNCLILIAYAVVVLAAARLKTRKLLE